MLKVSFFKGSDPICGETVFPLLSRGADSRFEKLAAPIILPSVSKYIADLRPLPNSQYVLVNAMGASEFYGQNINCDLFNEPALIHCPDNWTGVPEVDRELARDWPYGFPTFYYAHAFAHHRNKAPERAYGIVELAAWNPTMRRVELVIRVDKDKCEKFGGVAIWDKLKLGQYVDVSMGAKVPFDVCTICADWNEYRKAQATFDPQKHKYEGTAVLEYHKKLKGRNGTGIRGVSITRADYCEHMKNIPGKILSDGRRVGVLNDYPRFFDISFVLMGADKTAKVMWKVASDERIWSLPGAEAAESFGYEESLEELTKAAEVENSVDNVLKLAFLGKSAKLKRGEIEKHGPAQFDSKAIPALTKGESYIPNEVLDECCQFPLPSIFSSTASLGVPLRPREFQRIILIKMGLRPMADELESKNTIFPLVRTQEPTSTFDDAPVVQKIVDMLGSLFEGRSALPSALEKRIVVMVQGNNGAGNAPSSHPSSLLTKIGAAYSDYRKSLMNYWERDRQNSLAKLAEAPSTSSLQYLKHAYWNEVGKL